MRVVTPGTLTDAGLLDEKRDSLLAALVIRDHVLGIASLNLASGALRVRETAIADLSAELERLQPAEILVPRDSAPRRSVGRRQP